MDTHYIEFRCPAKNVEKDRVCNGLLGGPAIDIIKNYNFESGAFKQLSYCPQCSNLIEIEIQSIYKFPKINIVKRKSKTDYCVKFVPAEEYFGFIEAVQ
jgi:hypothetical protein